MILGITLDVGFGPTVGDLERGGVNMTAGHAAFAEVLAASGGRVGASSRATDVGREELPHDEADGADDDEESIDTGDEDSREAFGGPDVNGSIVATVALEAELRFTPSHAPPLPSLEVAQTERSETSEVEGGQLRAASAAEPRRVDTSRPDPSTQSSLRPTTAETDASAPVRDSLESGAEGKPSRDSTADVVSMQSSPESAEAVEYKTELVPPAAAPSSAIDDERVEAEGTDQAEHRQASDPPAAARLPSTPVDTLTHAGFSAHDRSSMPTQAASATAASSPVPSIATADASAAEVEPLGLADRLVMRERADAPTEVVAEVNGDDEAVRLRVTTHGREVSVEAQAMSPRLAELLREHPVALQEALSRHDLVLRGWETGTGPGDDRPPPPRQDRTVPATGNDRGSSPTNEHAPTESVLPGSLRVLA